MYFMLDLPINKANFILKNTQDFNWPTHVGPQDLNVFTDNIISIKNLKKRSCNGMSWLFEHGMKKF